MSVMAFSIKFTEGVRPGKKLQTLKRSAEEIYDVAHESARTKLAFSSKQQDGFDNIFVTSVCIYIDILKVLRLLHDFYLITFIE
jgi:hypothetical protein